VDDPTLTGIFVAPVVTPVNAPLVPSRYSIESAARIVSVKPSNLTAVAAGVAGRRGRIISVAMEDGRPPVALKRTLSVTSFRAVAEGIMFAKFSEVEFTAVHLLPFVLNSIRFETPLKVSPCVFKVRPVGAAGAVEACAN